MNQNTNVNVVPSYGQRGELHFSQYDVGRTATINLYGVNEAFSIPASSTVKIQATKPSGLGFNESCTYSGNVVTVVCTETMTEEAGRFPCELQITKDSDIIGTANFMFCVEPSPHPDGTVDGDSEEIINEIEALVLQSEGYAVGTQNGVPVTSESPYYHNNAKYYSENIVLPEELKQALLNCFSKVAWIDQDGQDYYDALETALDPQVVLVSITCVYTQSGTVYNDATLNSLKDDLVVTAHYDDSSSAVITSYTLSGSLTVGTSTITVTYGSQTTTFNVTVTSNTTRMWFTNDWTMTSTNGNVPYIDSNTKPTPRGVGMCQNGTHPFRLTSSSGSYSNYYPVEIPNGVTGITISSNYLDVGCVEFYYNGTDLIRLTSAGWLLKSAGVTHNYTFQNASTTYIGIPLREAGKASGGVVSDTAIADLTFDWQ